MGPKLERLLTTRLGLNRVTSVPFTLTPTHHLLLMIAASTGKGMESDMIAEMVNDVN